MTTQVVPGLWIGGGFDVRRGQEASLQSKGIRLIVNCARELGRTQDEDSFDYLALELDDDPDQSLIDAAVRALQAVRPYLKGNGETAALVHCSMGVSRSAAVVTFILACEYDWSMQKALTYLQSVYPPAQPSPAFIQQLEQWAAETDELSG